MGTMKIFIARGECPRAIILYDMAFIVHDIDVPEPETFITRKRDPPARFIHAVTPLANVYNLPMSTAHLLWLSGRLKE